MRKTKTNEVRGARSEQAVRLAVVLRDAGVLADEDVETARHQGAMAAARLQAADNERRVPSAIATLLALELVDRRDGRTLEPIPMLRALSEQLEIPFERLDPLKLDAEFVTSFFSRPFALKHQMVVLREEEDAVVVACGDPLNQEARELAQRTVRRPVRFVLALPSEIERIVREFYGFRGSIQNAQRVIKGPRVEVQNFEQLVRVRGDRELEASDQHVVNAVDYLLRYAFEVGASDIHVEPRREDSRAH